MTSVSSRWFKPDNNNTTIVSSWAFQKNRCRAFIRSWAVGVRVAKAGACAPAGTPLQIDNSKNPELKNICCLLALHLLRP